MRHSLGRRASPPILALLTAAAYLLLAVAVPLVAPTPLGAPFAAADEGVERESREIARLLKCPVCQNVSVADSSSELAGQMRELIRRKLEAGETREEIVAYFAERYGEDVLLEPPKAGFGGLVWTIGVLIPLVGLAFAWSFWRSARARRPEPQPSAEDDASEEELAEAEARLEYELERARCSGA